MLNTERIRWEFSWQHVNASFFGLILDEKQWIVKNESSLNINCKTRCIFISSIKGFSIFLTEATYLSWIDARESGLEDPAVFFENAGVGLSDGAEFGSPGFLRLNFGCPRATLEEALKRMKSAVNNQ